MRLTSQSFSNGQPIPAEFAAGHPGGFAPNRNPHLAWDEVPAGTRSFSLLCIDPDIPTVPEMAGRVDVEIPVDQPRTDFVHWVMADLSVNTHEIAAGGCSDGFVVRGKRAPAGPAGTRQGLNSYTEWFSGHPDLAGEYLGYDGPYPPCNDQRLHRYYFRLFALDVEQLELPTRFGAGDVLRAMQGHILGEAALHGTYTLHPKLR